jgi:methylenetetrahydrofolate reductase (NADPH)
VSLQISTGRHLGAIRQGLDSMDLEIAGTQRRLLEDFSIEILPSSARTSLAKSAAKLPRGTEVYIAHTSNSSEQIVDAGEAVFASGLTPVPHLPVRRFESKEALRSLLKSLVSRAGVRKVLLIGGDCAKPLGPFDECLDAVRSGVLQDFGIRCVVFAGHPEGHPKVDADALTRSLSAKCLYAAREGMEVQLTTQFVFDIRKVLDWHASVIAPMLPGTPINVGLPGLVRTATLLRFAAECGVQASFEMLKNHARRAIGLVTSTFSPGEDLSKLADGVAQEPASAIRSAHFFPFAAFSRTVDWAVAARVRCRSTHAGSVAA